MSVLTCKPTFKENVEVVRAAMSEQLYDYLMQATEAEADATLRDVLDSSDYCIELDWLVSTLNPVMI